MIADPKLLSLMEKINHPIQELTINMKVHGVYGFPDEWRVTDEFNQGIFGNMVRFEGEDCIGKIRARELTEREKYEELQKGKKGKKDNKLEEEGTMKNIILAEEEEEARRHELLAHMSDQDKAFMVTEDRFKTANINFPDVCLFTIQDVRRFENDIINKKTKIVFIRQPAISEEELVKLRKAKTKNLNNAELTQLAFSGNIDLSPFLEPGLDQIIVRVPLIQEESADAPKYNTDKLYVKVELHISPALTPLVTDIDPPQIPTVSIEKIPTKQQCVQAFQYDITLAMQSLAEEYAKLFQSDQKARNISITMTAQKKQELQKKKEQFLTEINSSGKYKILKDRLRTSIVRVCIDKFSKEGLFVGVNKDEQDRLFAELYVFMMEEMQKTLGTFIHNNKEEIHEDLMQSYEQNIRERDRVFSLLFKESQIEKFQRLASEYEIINQKDQALKYYINMVIVDKKCAFQFAKYCIKIQRFRAAEQLIEIASEPDKEHKLLMASLYIRRERYSEALEIIQTLLVAEPINTLLNLFMSFILKLQGNVNLSDKYTRCTQRIFMRTMGLLNKSFNKQQPDPHILPNFKQKMIEQQEQAKKAPVLTPEQIDQIQMELVEYFSSKSIFDLSEKAMATIKDKNTPKIMIIRAQIHIFNENYPAALEMISKILTNNPKNYEVYLIKGSLCYQTEQFYEAEETFLKALSLQYKKSFGILLRLGYLYIKRKSWQDAKVIFEKALDATPNSSLSWLGLGIALLRLGENSEECFQQANIYEPFNGEVWGYMALNCLFQKRGQQAKQCLKRMEATEVNDLDLLFELGDEMFRYQDYESSRQLYMRIYHSKIIIPTQGQLLKKLGQVNKELRKPQEAIKFFEESLDHLIGENEKQEVFDLIKSI